MSPKSLLRHKLAVSSLDELANGRFETVIEDVKRATQGGTSFTLVLALNYGGRNEIVRAIKIAKIGTSGSMY